MGEAFIVDALRTPIGKYGGALAGVRPDDLAAHVIGAAVERNGIDPAAVDDVIFGDANQAGEDNRNVARMGALLAGLPVEIPGATVNRLCASGLEAVNQSARAVKTGEGDVLAGRRGRVDDPGAAGPAQARQAPSRAARPRWPTRRSAGASSTRGWDVLDRGRWARPRRTSPSATR